MITKVGGYLRFRDTDGVPPESVQLERDGYAVLSGLLNAVEIAELAADLDRVFDEEPPDLRNTRVAEGHFEPFRYESLNRSAVAQRTIAHPQLLAVLEPLLGEGANHRLALQSFQRVADHGFLL